MAGKQFILVEVADNDPATALVEKLMEEMGGEVVDVIGADSEVIEELGKPSITWEEDL